MRHKSLEDIWISFDYGYLLPWIGRLPVSIGRFFASLRGYAYAYLGRDWRQFSFDDVNLKSRTVQALKEVMPEATDALIRKQLRRRYVMQSLEELEACWLQIRDFNKWPVEYFGLEYVQEAIRENRRAVFVTAHFSSSILGTIFLQKLGIPVLGMSSNVVEDQRVHPTIGRFYRRKYAAMSSYLKEGGIIDRQGNSRKFVDFLKKGGALVIVGDLPPDPQEHPYEAWFVSKRRAFASGAERLAKIGGVPLMSFVCEYSSKGYKVTFSRARQAPFSLFDEKIKIDPGAWWAADLLPLLPLVPTTTDEVK